MERKALVEQERARMEDSRVSGKFSKDHGFRVHDQEFMIALWDDARTARLSELYYGDRIKSLSRWNFGIELLVAVAASGSGIAGWAVWQQKIGGLLWALIAGLAAIAAIAKPMLALDRTLQHATRQQQIYRSILGDLENLAFNVQQADSLTTEHRQRFQRLRETLRHTEDADDAAPSTRLQKVLEERVRREMPVDRLWVPMVGLEHQPA